MNINSEIRITPSILSADHANLSRDISKIANASDLIHLDIMDNIFVPNLTWDFSASENIIANCPIPVDAHLMVQNVDQIALQYAEIGTASVTIHAEATNRASKTLREIRRMGSRSGLALKPKSQIEDYVEILADVDMLLIMTVEPGFGGQKFMEDMVEKVRKSKRAIGDRPIWLQVDGGISMETIAIAREAGADTFVAGSAVFNAPEPAVMVEMLRHRASEL
jgi:ribulose-phosphate 3-epimerase